MRGSREIVLLMLALNIFSVNKSVLSSEIGSYLLEEVKVVSPAKTKNLEKISQEVKIIKGKEVLEFGPEIFSALELKERGAFGVQSDLSIRGTTFEQNLVTLEGIRLSDPQTAHHLMNFSWEKDILESIEILSGGASAIYGPGGFGGAVNFNLKPSAPGLKILAEYGSYDYKNIFGNLGFSTPFSPFNLIFSQKKANGFIWNRDFDIRSFNLYTKDEKKVIYYGFQEKDFGARNFYTTKWDTEWEQTKTHLFLAKKNIYGGNWFLEPTLLYRINYDVYLLDRKNPEFYKNSHKSQTIRINLPLRYDTSLAEYLLGTELSYETLDSSRLGDHLRRGAGFYLWIYPKISSKFFPSIGLRYDTIIHNKDMFSYNLGFAYLLKPDLKLRGSFGFSYRIPSFTELYYDSPTIKGNSSLSPEKAYNIEAGFDYSRKRLTFSGTVFYRHGKDIIDWIAQEGIIQAQNIETLKTTGFTLDGKVILKNFSPFVSYTYLNQVAENLSSARYKGSYLRHNLILGISAILPLDLEFFGSLNYRKYYKRDSVFLANLKIRKVLHKNIVYSFWINNLFDEEYTEVGEVIAPPQWIGNGLEIRF
ncbi:MAG: TonB-dependent receptor [Thermodesulfobacterium sp.]|nr:TonB-dependent receptor [Thermodesulfobacterium sp.]